MNLKKVGKNIENLVNECEIFLSIDEIDDEEKEKINKPFNPLHIMTFNNIIDECKMEIRNSNLDKIANDLQLLYRIKSDPFDYHTISEALDNFVTNQLKSTNLHVSEESLKIMVKITENIKIIQESLKIEMKRLTKEAENFYVFNKKSRKKIIKYSQILKSLENKICIQMEYDSKIIAKNIIEDFYNTYIFLSFLIKLAIAKNQYILGIEIANAIDRYTNIVSLVFNGRKLKNQDMLYYYLIHELNELKNIIYEDINEKGI